MTAGEIIAIITALLSGLAVLYQGFRTAKKDDLEALRGIIKEYRDDNDAMRLEIDELRTENIDLRMEIVNLKTQNADKDRRILFLETSLKNQIQARADRESRIQELETEIGELRDKVKVLESRKQKMP